ncbi:bifunctional diaminohydroxyphosphoribosylaminopyrimidine deaminase/5-amino-6-(5-phosphoribosylamino)uracil reductase RibD [Parasediminibacterium paludis]|uniref:Riboflavin biosynthesis protein RibD n=1 Tax=Parasediminibacterium paludis TaxID=908966 RepID=A0ABV8PTZ4_9BACT
MTLHEQYLLRCLQLAKLGEGNVAPNPMVGSVLVYDNRIIGEGYHQQYGQAHAEVNCINSVAKADMHLIPLSTIYVSLEPCAHFGKTPPCSDLIIKHGIKKVVVGCTDSFKQVDGKGIEKLRLSGADVTVGVLENYCRALNKKFFTFHEKKRPFVMLKWAETANRKIGTNTNNRLLISNNFSNRLVHQLRQQNAAILVGTNTALLDNPSLTNRLWYGKNPTRLVIDKDLTLPTHLQLFNQAERTIVFNYIKQEEREKLTYYKLNKEADLLEEILAACYQLNIQSLLVEGGTKTLQSFIDQDVWDEVVIITNNSLVVNNGVSAPILSHHVKAKQTVLLNDIITYFTNPNNSK